MRSYKICFVEEFTGLGHHPVTMLVIPLRIEVHYLGKISERLEQFSKSQDWMTRPFLEIYLKEQPGKLRNDESSLTKLTVTQSNKLSDFGKNQEATDTTNALQPEQVLFNLEAATDLKEAMQVYNDVQKFVAVALARNSEHSTAIYQQSNHPPANLTPEQRRNWREYTTMKTIIQQEVHKEAVTAEGSLFVSTHGYSRHVVRQARPTETGTNQMGTDLEAN